MSRVSIARFAGFAILAVAAACGSAASQEAEHAAPTHFPILPPEPQSWTFAGFLGRYDPAQLQRGFQIYQDVCSDCHSLNHVAFRNLAEEGGVGFSEEEVKALAAGYKFQVTDGPNDQGEMFERPARPSDRIPPPFPNPQAAAYANNGAAPPDLSLMAKARAAPRGPLWTVLDFFTQYQEAGPDYIHALLTGYGQTPPEGLTIPDGVYYNPHFLSAAALAMPPPLSDGQVTYGDGSPETVDQYARDVSAFLMWAAEPTLVDRKRLGFQVAIFLIIFGVLMFLTKRKVWAHVAH